MAHCEQLFPNGREGLLHLPGHGWDEVHVVIHTLEVTQVSSCRFREAPYSLHLSESLALSLQYIVHTGQAVLELLQLRWSPGPELEPEVRGSAPCTGALAA